MTDVMRRPLFKDDTLTGRGRWRLLILGKVRHAMITCPSCGKQARTTSHEIFPNGCVVPSLSCPYPECNFHDHVRLLDWPGIERRHP